MSRTALALVALGALALAGCSQEPPPTPENDMTIDEPAPPPPSPPPPPPPPVSSAPPVVETPREAPMVDTNDVDVIEPVDPSEQTLDDADAVGMTTRARRSDADDGESFLRNRDGSGED